MAFEKYLVDYCSPTLASVKTANLFNWFYESSTELWEQVSYWNLLMNPKGVYLYVLKEHPKKALIYVCRKSRLAENLSRPGVAAFLAGYGYGELDVDAAIEQVRGALARTITRRFCEDGQLRVVTLDAEVEKKIISSLTRNEQGVYLAMGPDLMQQIVTQMAEYIRKFNELSQTPVILVSQVIRGYFSKMITQFYPSVYVLSFNEVTSSVQIQAIGNIAMDTASRKAVAR